MSRTQDRSVPLDLGRATAERPPADPEAHRFLEALQPRLMGPRLARAMGGGPPTCHVLDAKFEPGVRATVLYAHAGRLLRGDLVAAGAGSAGSTAERPAVVPPGLRVRVFPDDPDLPALPLVMDGARLGPLLAEATAHRPGAVDPRRAARCRVQLLRYRPGKRATVLVSPPGAPALVVKAYHDGGKAAAVAAEAPGVATATSHGVLRLAPLLAHVPELSLVAQQEVHGLSLDRQLTGRGPANGLWSAADLVAQALAELHEAAALSARLRPVERELHRFAVRAQRIATVDPEAGAALAALAGRLTELYPRLPAARTGLVHGDCKPSQFLLAGRWVYLLDMDHCGVSDQAADVGTFLASLRQLGVRHTLAARSPALPAALDAFAERFLDAYLRWSGADDASRARIGWQEAVALERKALRAFARAPHSPLPAALANEAHRRLGRTEAA